MGIGATPRPAVAEIDARTVQWLDSAAWPAEGSPERGGKINCQAAAIFVDGYYTY